MKRKALSVAICTRNPNPGRFSLVLEALKAQSLPLKEWDLIVIDNGSSNPVAQSFSFDWHPNARVVVEHSPGHVRARLRAMRENKKDLIVFVDDDNVLAPNYLDTALETEATYPFLGAWGGLVLPVFDSPPPEWTKPHWGLFGKTEVKRATWTNEFFSPEALPIGAGLCFRREVADLYIRMCEMNPIRLELGRHPKRTFSADDEDLCYMAVKAGFGYGVLPQLSLTHLIPTSRLEENYLIELEAGCHGSGLLIRLMWNQPLDESQKFGIKSLGDLIRHLRRSPRDRKLMKAREANEKLAQEVWDESIARLKRLTKAAA